MKYLVALGVVAAVGAAVWTNWPALRDEADTQDVGSAAAAVAREPTTITALGRIEPHDGVRRVAGPSNPSVVIGRLLVEEGDPVSDPLPRGRGLDGQGDRFRFASSGFGARFDAQGVLAGSRDASRCIGYLTKYLTKHLGDCHQAATDAQANHAERLADALRYEPCSPTCANWLRYGIQPKTARPGLRPGACKGKAHRREHLGYAGRRVLVSRKWFGKTLADHRTWLTSALGLPATDPARYTWEPVKPGDPDHMPNGQRLLHVVADRIQWQTALDLARRIAAGPTVQLTFAKLQMQMGLAANNLDTDPDPLNRMVIDPLSPDIDRSVLIGWDAAGRQGAQAPNPSEQQLSASDRRHGSSFGQRARSL
jgi:hypothetical protein